MRSGNRSAGCGSGIGLILVLLVAGGAIVEWPKFVDARGASASGVITEKNEKVRVSYGSWYRHFEVTAGYSIPGERMEHRAACEVDERTFDSLHKGDTVAVHYFRNLLTQPFLPATHLAPCTTLGSIGRNSATKDMITAAVALLAILFLWRVLRIDIAGWLLLPWLGFTIALFVLPRAEPAPRHPAPAIATVDRIDTITMIDERRPQASIPLLRPYQIVTLKFVPPGKDTAVIAVDKVDEHSVPELREGASVPIVYDSENPRTA